jgi:hypothetical protein
MVIFTTPEALCKWSFGWIDVLKALRKDQIGIGVMGHDHVLIMLVIILF